MKLTRKPKMVLPPDPENQNNDRSGWAKVATDAFQAETGVDVEDAISDLISDIGHLCDRHSEYGDFTAQVDRGIRNYQEETLTEDQYAEMWKKGSGFRDFEAMDKIHELLDGREWSPDTLNEIANIVRTTGREILRGGTKK